jgi:hypothetical protein
MPITKIREKSPEWYKFGQIQGNVRASMALQCAGQETVTSERTMKNGKTCERMFVKDKYTGVFRDYWKVVTGQLIPDPPTEAAQEHFFRGTTAEPFILDLFAEITGLNLIKEECLYIHDKYPWLGASPDGISLSTQYDRFEDLPPPLYHALKKYIHLDIFCSSLDEDEWDNMEGSPRDLLNRPLRLGIEIKCPLNVHDAIPLPYLIQMNTQMHCAKFDACLFVSYNVKYDVIRTYLVLPWKDTWSFLLNRWEQYRRYLLYPTTDLQPPPFIKESLPEQPIIKLYSWCFEPVSNKSDKCISIISRLQEVLKAGPSSSLPPPDKKPKQQWEECEESEEILSYLADYDDNREQDDNNNNNNNKKLKTN